VNKNEWAELARELIRAVSDNGPNAAEIWSAVGTWITLLVGGIALCFAKGQLDEASKAREQNKMLEREKSQPYVVAYLEENGASPHILDLVVKNFGQTAGRNIRLSFSPTLNRTKNGRGEEPVTLPEAISFLAPGQEWRTIFDVMLERSGRDDLPMMYKGIVDYDGLDGEAQKSDVVIDLRPYKTRRYTEVLGIHHAAKTLREIRDTHKKWTEGVQGGLQVYSRDGDVRDEEKARQFREYQEQRAAEPKPPRRARARPGQAPTVAEEQPEPTGDAPQP